MNLLLITNLYPPQELGGYGRCMADFAWGLMQRGHNVQVLCNDAPYLGPSVNGPNNEPVSRSLQLKGDFRKGIKIIRDPEICRRVDIINTASISQFLTTRKWDGVLLGNVDLIGPEQLPLLLSVGVPIVQHVGFVGPPYDPAYYPNNANYKLVSASQAVRDSLVNVGFPVTINPIIYPGARIELFGLSATKRSLPEIPDGSPARPLKVCFAGLLMSTKGAHTFIESLILLQNNGINIQANLAGGDFQEGYREQLESMLKEASLDGTVRFLGQLNRIQLARFFRLHHACIFPSILPEAFGIVGAEAMASGLVLISSGVGGAAELIEDNVSGLRFNPGDAVSLANTMARLVNEPGLIQRLSMAGQARSKVEFSVNSSAEKLEMLFQSSVLNE